MARGKDEGNLLANVGSCKDPHFAGQVTKWEDNPSLSLHDLMTKLTDKCPLTVKKGATNHNDRLVTRFYSKPSHKTFHSHWPCHGPRNINAVPAHQVGYLSVMRFCLGWQPVTMESHGPPQSYTALRSVTLPAAHAPRSART